MIFVTFIPFHFVQSLKLLCFPFMQLNKVQKHYLATKGQRTLPGRRTLPRKRSRTDEILSSLKRGSMGGLPPTWVACRHAMNWQSDRKCAYILCPRCHQTRARSIVPMKRKKGVQCEREQQEGLCSNDYHELCWLRPYDKKYFMPNHIDGVVNQAKKWE